MAFLGAVGAAAIGGLVDIAGGIAKNIANKYFPNEEERAKVELDIYKTLMSSDLAQLEVNKVEAGHRSIFVAGWRPFIGWVCGAALAYQYLVLPLGIYLATIFSEKVATIMLNAPKLDDNMWQLLIGMLGMGALRSFDKMKGTSR